MFLCILSNTLLKSRRSRYTISSVHGIFLSIISLVANVCSVVDLFLRYVVWDMGIAKANLKLTLFIIQTAKLFLRTDKRIIGRRFDVGLFGFSGFCSALQIPCAISFVYFPVAAILLHISAISLCTTSSLLFYVNLIHSRAFIIFGVHTAFLFLMM